MTPEREGKRVERAIRTIPADAIAPDIAATESRGEGLWCLVDGEVSFVLVNAEPTLSNWCDPLAHTQYIRWLKSHPERIHDSHESAVRYVRRQLGEKGRA